MIKNIYKSLLFVACLNVQVNLNGMDVLVDGLSKFCAKYILIFASDITSTIVHEGGHGLISKLRGSDTHINIGSEGEDDSDEDDQPLIRYSSPYDPSIGYTSSWFNNEQLHEHDRNIAQFAIGPVCDILTRFVQLYMLDKFKEKLPEGVAQSLADYITAAIVFQITYIGTPFHGGDGEKLFQSLHCKYHMKTDFFQKAGDLAQPYHMMRKKMVDYYLYYHLVHFTLKIIRANKLLDKLDKKLNNPFFTPIINYTKYSLSLGLTAETHWTNRIALQSLLF